MATDFHVLGHDPQMQFSNACGRNVCMPEGGEAIAERV